MLRSDIYNYPVENSVTTQFFNIFSPFICIIAHKIFKCKQFETKHILLIKLYSLFLLPAYSLPLYTCNSMYIKDKTIGQYYTHFLEVSYRFFISISKGIMTPLGEEADIVHLQKAFPRNELTEREGLAPATSSPLSKKREKVQDLLLRLVLGFPLYSRVFHFLVFFLLVAKESEHAQDSCTKEG